MKAELLTLCLETLQQRRRFQFGSLRHPCKPACPPSSLLPSHPRVQRADGQFPISYNPTDFADKAVLIRPKPLRLLDCRPDIPSLSTARPLLSTATSPLMPCECCCLVERRCALELGASGPGQLALQPGVSSFDVQISTMSASS